jgi:hypothetical protein
MPDALLGASSFPKPVPTFRDYALPPFPRRRGREDNTKVIKPEAGTIGGA